MGLKFEGYRVGKDDFWDAVDEIRDLYYEKYPATEVVRELVEAFIEKPEDFDYDSAEVMKKMSELQDAFADRAIGYREDYKRERLVQLQVYDMGESYVFRVLEPDYFFDNAVAEHLGGNHMGEPGMLDPFWYSGTTMKRHSDGAKAQVEEVAELQENGRYFLVPILEVDDMSDVYFQEKREDLAEAAKKHRN
jgi:hypothetical protein